MAVCQCFPRRSWPSQCLALSPHCFALSRTGSFLLPRHVAHRQLAIVGHLIEFGIGPSVMIIWILLGEYCKLPQRVGVVVRVLFFSVLARVYKSATACPNPSGYSWPPLSSLLPVTWPRSLRATSFFFCGREVLGRHLAGQLCEPLSCLRTSSWPSSSLPQSSPCRFALSSRRVCSSISACDHASP